MKSNPVDLEQLMVMQKVILKADGATIGGVDTITRYSGHGDNVTEIKYYGHHVFNVDDTHDLRIEYPDARVEEGQVFITKVSEDVEKGLKIIEVKPCII